MVGWIASHTFAMEAVADYAAALADAKEADIRLEAAMAKLFCSEVGFQVVDRALQVRGGRGYETVSSLEARGDVPFPIERFFREARLNTIVEGSSEILHLFLAREALDPHFRRAGALVQPGASFLAKARSAIAAGLFYVPWYLKRWIPSFGTPDDIPSLLRGHWRWTRSNARRLARRILYAMARYGPGLEHRQALLARLVDEGVDLMAMAVTIARAASRREESSAELADLFCRHTRSRVRQRRLLRAADDRCGHRVGTGILDGRYPELETGILPHVREDAQGRASR